MSSNVRKHFEKNLKITSKESKKFGNKLDELEKKLETTSKKLENKLEELEKKLDNKLEEMLRILKPE